MYTEYLTKIMKAQLRKDGIYQPRILQTARDPHGYPNYLIEGKDHSGQLCRGWWKEGESANDIRWETENVDGWPGGVA